MNSSSDRIPGSFRHRLRAPSSKEGRKECINKEDTGLQALYRWLGYA